MAEGLASLEELLDVGNIARLYQGETVDAIMKLLSEANVDVTEARQDGSSLLHSFAILGCLDIVKLLWDKGARPTILKLDDSTVLHSTVRARDDSQDAERASILEFFLSSEEPLGNSMPLDHANSKGWTALKLATKKNLEKCVEVVLEHGANPDIADSEQYTALHNAVANPAILKLLLTKTKDINQKNQDGETALYAACEMGQIECALQLLEHGADPNATNKDEINPLFVAARGGYLDLVKALVKKGAQVNVLGASQGIGPLHWAAHKEHEEIATFLIENGGNILLQDREGRTPLSMASPELAQKMIVVAQRVNPGIVTPLSTPMSAKDKAMAACCGGNVQALQALLQAGVSVNYSSGSTHSTLLHMAAYCGQLTVVAFLMHLGADCRAVDKDGDTVLHFACMKDVPHGHHDKTLEFLLSSPVVALKDTQNGRGDTPIMVATRCQFVSRVKILLKAKASVSIANHKKELPLHKACCSESALEALFHFVDHGGSINVQDDDGWTPLLYAVKANSSLIVKYLLQRGADPNIRQGQGFSALYLAAQEDNPTVCELLLECGANPLLAGGQQKLSPLHIAAHRGCSAVCVVLVEHGADIHQRDSDGDTPISLADTPALKQAMESAYSAFQEHSSNEPRDLASSNELANGNNRTEEQTERRENMADEHSESEVSNENPRTGAEERRVVNETHKLKKQLTHSKSAECEEQLVTELQELRRRVVELESEVDSLHGDKHLLLSRVKCLEEEREMTLTTGRESSHVRGSERVMEAGHWWHVSRSEFEVTGKQINDVAHATGKFFQVFPGHYRHMPVAVKKVSKVTKWTEDVYRLFRKEVNVISQLQCPCLVQFLGACVDVGGCECVLLTEFMSRGNLQVVLHEDRIPLDWITRTRIVREVCMGMVFLHSHQMLHGSLVPRNILISEHFNAKLSDFGLHETKTESGYFADLIEQCQVLQVYRAPEVMEKLELSAASDVYSFGIIMCEVATGNKPFSDMQLGPVVLVMKVLMGARPSFNGGIPRDYKTIAEKCWNGDPDLRPTFLSVLTELSQF